MDRGVPIRGRLTVAFVGLFLLSGPSVSAAVDMFLRIEGIAGESRDATHRGAIDVLSFSWELSRGIQRPRARGAVEIRDLAFTKHVDRASPALLLACAEGRRLGRATLILRKAGAQPLDYVRIELSDVLVTSVYTGSESQGEQATESVTLNFSEVRVVYTPQRDDGSADASIEFRWNLRENRGEVSPDGTAPARGGREPVR